MVRETEKEKKEKIKRIEENRYMKKTWIGYLDGIMKWMAKQKIYRLMSRERQRIGRECPPYKISFYV